MRSINVPDDVFREINILAAVKRVFIYDIVREALAALREKNVKEKEKP